MSTEQEASATARTSTQPRTACDNTSSSAREAHAQGDERPLQSRRAPRPAELRNNTSANLDRAARNNAGNKGLQHGARGLSNSAGQHPSGSGLAVREHTRSLGTRFRNGLRPQRCEPQIGGAAWRVNPRLRARSVKTDFPRRMRRHPDLSSERTFPLTYLPLACRNRPSQRTQTGPLPNGRKNKGPSENLRSKAQTGESAARLSGC